MQPFKGSDCDNIHDESPKSEKCTNKTPDSTELDDAEKRSSYDAQLPSAINAQCDGEVDNDSQTGSSDVNPDISGITGRTENLDENSAINTDDVNNRIPTVVETSVGHIDPVSVGDQVYYQEVDRIENFSETDDALLDKYGTCVPGTGNVPCQTQNVPYQSYQCQPVYSYQPDTAQVYSHYQQQQFNQQQTSVNNHDQTSQEGDSRVSQTDQRNFTSLSSDSQQESKPTAVKSEPENVSPGPPASTVNWPTYIPVPNVDMTDYQHCQQYGDYAKQEARDYSGTTLNVPAKPICDPMLAGSEMDDLAQLENQAYQVPTTSGPVCSTSVKYEYEPFNLTRSRQYGDQYNRTVAHASEQETKPKKVVKVPAGKFFDT